MPWLYVHGKEKESVEFSVFLDKIEKWKVDVQYPCPFTLKVDDCVTRGKCDVRLSNNQVIISAKSSAVPQAILHMIATKNKDDANDDDDNDDDDDDDVVGVEGIVVWASEKISVCGQVQEKQPNMVEMKSESSDIRFIVCTIL